MNYKSITLIYFSPTSATKKYINKLSEMFNADIIEEINLTYEKDRSFESRIIKSECVIIGFPVYEEYVPELFLSTLNKIIFNNQPLICLATYGKIGYGLSLQQINEFALSKSLKPIIMAAFIAEHSFSTKSNKLAHDRPDNYDFDDVKLLYTEFTDRINKGSGILKKDDIKGVLPLMSKLLPKNSAKFFTKTPIINTNCNACMLCIKKCPVNAIEQNLSITESKCIRCFACVKNCKVNGREIKYKKSVLVKLMFQKTEKIEKSNLIV